MEWMYKAPEPSKEEYLLGRKVDKFIESEKEGDNKLDLSGERGAILNERIQANIEMDMAAKRREDPLFQIRQREEEARKKIIQNPVKMKQLQQLIAQREEDLNKKKKHKPKKKKKKKERDSDSGDELMERYLAALSKKHHQDVTKDVNNEQGEPRERDSGDDHEEKVNKHPGKKSRLKDSDDEDDGTSRGKRYGLLLPASHRRSKLQDGGEGSSPQKTFNKHSSADKHRHKASKDRSTSPEGKSRSGKDRSRSPTKRESRASHKYNTTTSKSQQQSSASRRKLTTEEKARKLEEMMENANWRKNEREKNVRKFAEDDEKEDKGKKAKGNFLHSMMAEHAASSSVEDRIKRNMHNIQRRRVDLDKNFTKQ